MSKREKYVEEFEQEEKLKIQKYAKGIPSGKIKKIH